MMQRMIILMALIMSAWSSATAQPAGGDPSVSSTLPSPSAETQVKCTCRPCGCFEILPPPPPPPPKPYKSYCPPPPAPYLNIIGQPGSIYPLIPSSSERKFYTAGGEKMVFLVSFAVLLNLGWLSWM